MRERGGSRTATRPTAFDEELDQLLTCLEDRPTLVGLSVKQAPGVRRVYLRRIRFYVYVQVIDDRVEVIAVWHGSRDGEPI